MIKIKNNCLENVDDDDLTNGTIAIPEGVDSIGVEAFATCSSLTHIIIPEGVTSLGTGVFEDCHDLSSIDFEPIDLSIMRNEVEVKRRELEGLSSIGDFAFANCRCLTVFSAPESVKDVGDRAFYNCHGLTTVCFSENVATIGGEVFYGCDHLTSILISARTDAEFQRVKALLPLEAQSLADHNGEKKFRPLMDAIHRVLADNPNGMDGNALEQVTESIEAAQTHIESMSPFPAIYQQQKEELDSLIASAHLQQPDDDDDESYAANHTSFKGQ